MPKISVVMPVYNGEIFLKESIESILHQSYDDFEFIIIDDGSTDETNTIISSYSEIDKRIKYIQNKENLGIIKTLNKGISAASGELIARMDADDISLPDRFRKQVNCFSCDDSLVLCGSWFHYLFNNKKKKLIKLPVKDSEVKSRFIWGSQFAHPSVMFRRNIRSFGIPVYKEENQTAEDFGLWVELINNGKVYNIPEPLLLYRVHDNSITSSIISKNIDERIETSNRIYQKIFKSLFALSYEDCIEHVYLSKPELLVTDKKDIIPKVYNWTKILYKKIDNSLITEKDKVRKQIVGKWNDFCVFHSIDDLKIGTLSENVIYGIKPVLLKIRNRLRCK